MRFEFMIGMLLLGCTFGYLHYQWGCRKDEKKRSELGAEMSDWDWYQVKLRLPYMHTEAGRGLITIEVKAKNKEHAQEVACKILKHRSMTRCTWVAVNKMYE